MPCKKWSMTRVATPAAEANPISTDGLPTPAVSGDVELWKNIRKYNLRMMRKQVRQIVLFMALIEALRVGPVQIVFAGKNGYPAPAEDDFGIAYNVGYFMSWLYVCLFMIIWVPMFQWWVERLFPETPGSTDKPSFGSKVISVLQKVNMVLLPASIGLCLGQYIIYLGHTFIYVDTRTFGSNRLPKNSCKNWAARLFMLLGIAISVSSGYGSFQILATYDLAHVKMMEYLVIVLPIQINLGIFFGSLMQLKMEKRIARKQAIVLAAVKNEDASVDEKAALLEV